MVVFSRDLKKVKMKIKGRLGQLLEKCFKKYPKLMRFFWGDICPKCEAVMNISQGDYMECPLCGYKAKK